MPSVLAAYNHSFLLGSREPKVLHRYICIAVKGEISGYRVALNSLVDLGEQRKPAENALYKLHRTELLQRD
ncbi:MAG: hypothetical protein QXN93_00330 [Methanomassiliicoccales archaeon]